MGSLGQRDRECRHPHPKDRGKHFETDEREAPALLLQPCFVHRSNRLEERQAHRSSVIPVFDAWADLFRRIANALKPGGRFVLADVVTPLNPSYVVTAIDPEVDYPSTLDEQLAWLDAAGMNPEVTWTHRDLVVIVGTARTSTPNA